MFDIGWMELMLIGVVALIVVGPRDLPDMFRQLGRFTAKLRAMGREFSRAMEQAAQESGVKDVANDLRKAASPVSTGMDAMKNAADKFEKWDPLKSRPAPQTPAAATTAAATAAPVAADTPAATAAEPAAVATPPAPTMGPATAALAQKQAARQAVAAEAAEKLRKVAAGDATASEADVAKKPGRTRKKADPASGDAA
ncbi:hypothetical protein MASR1M32_26450 [Rhodobacter sp.]